MRCSVAVKTVQVNYGSPLALFPSLHSNPAYSTLKNALLVAFSTAVWFPSSYLRIVLPANMQEVVKMTHAWVTRNTSATSGAQVNANRL